MNATEGEESSPSSTNYLSLNRERIISPKNPRSPLQRRASTSSRSPLREKSPEERDKEGTGEGPQTPPLRDAPPMSERERRWAVLLYGATTVLLFADQNLLAPNLTAAADEFGFTAEERDAKLGGHIALAFFVLGAPASFVVGCLADAVPRAPLFALTVLLGEGSCMSTYWTRTYRQLYVARALTGISVGGALPLVASVIGDLFESGERPAVMAAVGMGTGIGIALGQGAAGFLGPKFGWRLPFLVVSAPAVLCAVLVLLTVRDPERGEKERAVLERREGDGKVGTPAPSAIELSPPSDQSVLPGAEDSGSISSRSMHSAPVPRPHSLPSSRSGSKGSQCSGRGADDSFNEEEEFCARADEATTIGKLSQNRWGSILSHLCDWKSWLSHLHTLKLLLRCPTVLLTLVQGAPGCIPWGIVNTYLNDYLSEDRGMTVEGATLTVLAFGFGNFLGMCVGGAGGNYLYSKDPRLPCILAGSMAILGCIPLWVLINTVDATSSAVYTVSTSVLAGLGSGVTGPIVKATLTNATLPNTRGQAFALLNTFDDFGRGLGPVFVALLITSLGGRTAAFNVGVLGWILCGLLNMSIYFTAKKDEERIQNIIAEALQQSSLGHVEETGESGSDDVAPPSSFPATNGNAKADAVPLLT